MHLEQLDLQRSDYKPLKDCKSCRLYLVNRRYFKKCRCHVGKPEQIQVLKRWSAMSIDLDMFTVRRALVTPGHALLRLVTPMFASHHPLTYN